MTPLLERIERVAAAAERAGTPCYVYAPWISVERMQRLRGAMRAESVRIDVAYAVKANPRPEFLAALAATGCEFDVASLGELERVVACGVEGRRMVFSGPGKSAVEVERALAHGVRLNAEGERDLKMAREWARAQGRPVEVNLRVNPAGGRAYNLIGGSGPSRFGVDQDLLSGVLARWAPDEHVRIRGLQVFTASNVLAVDELLAHHCRSFEILEAFAPHGLELDTIDLGGGLGVPYAVAERELDVPALARNLAALLAGTPRFRGRVLLEPGRWIAGPAGAYVARVLEIKHSRGTRFAVIDGGIHHLVRPALIRMDQPCVAVRPGAGALPAGGPPTTFGGPLCTGLDILAHGARVGEVVEGDLVVFLQTGAYGETEAMPDFLLHPRPRIAHVEES